MNDRELLEFAAKAAGRKVILNPIDEVYGRLTVVREVERLNPRKRQFLCLCECGNEVSLNLNKLRSGHTRSCGCLHIETLRANRHIGGTPRHGLNKTPEHRAWVHMRQRCNNPKKKDYPHYGGRGITVCEAWQSSFEAFLAHVGKKPSPKHSLDRIDVNGNYEPGNVRWATQQQQVENTRVVKMITIDGKTQSQAAWAREKGLSVGQISARIRSGWSQDEAILTPSVSGQKRHMKVKRDYSITRAAAEIGRSQP